MGGSSTGDFSKKVFGKGFDKFASGTWPGYRIATGESFIGSDLKPKKPGDPTAIDAPQFDAGRDAAIRDAIISKMRQDIRRGGGRADTIATSAAGVTKRAPVKKKKLIGA